MFPPPPRCLKPGTDMARYFLRISRNMWGRTRKWYGRVDKRQLANRIWESANKLRSKIEANEYKDYILGFIFYKFLSDREEQFAKAEGISAEEIKSEFYETNAEVVNYLHTHLGYFIAYKDLFSTWLDKGSDFNVSDVRDALSAFARLVAPSHK